MARRVLIALAVVGVVVVAIGVLMFRSLGHRFYLVSGTALVTPNAVRATRLPALICSGHGGPLESSGVYGLPLGWEQDQSPRVFCSVPEQSISFQFKESVYSSHFPRRMHAYVWLEHHSELMERCAQATSPVINVPSRDLRGYGSQTPSEWPCHGPDRNGSLGYTIAFHDDVPGDHEVKQIEVKPRGYP